MYAVIPTLGIRYVYSFPQTRLPVGMITYLTSITQPLLLQSAYLMSGFFVFQYQGGSRQLTNFCSIPTYMEVGNADGVHHVM